MLSFFKGESYTIFQYILLLYPDYDLTKGTITYFQESSSVSTKDTSLRQFHHLACRMVFVIAVMEVMNMRVKQHVR